MCAKGRFALKDEVIAGTANSDFADGDPPRLIDGMEDGIGDVDGREAGIVDVFSVEPLGGEGTCAHLFDHRHELGHILSKNADACCLIDDRRG